MLPKYSKTYKEGKITYIESKSGVTYVLDDDTFNKKSYPNRRMDMMRKGDYELFPLKTKCSTIAEILTKGGEVSFIDNYGKVFRYRKGNKMMPIITTKIKNFKETPGRGTFIYTELSPSPLFVPFYFKEDLIPKYAALIDTPSGYLIYDMCNEKVYKQKRIKL